MGNEAHLNVSRVAPDKKSDPTRRAIALAT